MSPTKVLMLPNTSNRQLLSVLQRSYIREEFGTLLQGLANSIHNPMAANTPEFGHCVLRSINTIFLDNVMRYASSGEADQLARCLAHDRFVAESHIRLKYLDEIFSHWCPKKEDNDVEEKEVVKHLLWWMVHHFLDYRDEMAQALLSLYEEMLLYTPYRFITHYQYEISPQFHPVLIYSDCLHENHSLQ